MRRSYKQSLRRCSCYSLSGKFLLFRLGHMATSLTRPLQLQDLQELASSDFGDSIEILSRATNKQTVNPTWNRKLQPMLSEHSLVPQANLVDSSSQLTNSESQIHLDAHSPFTIDGNARVDRIDMPLIQPGPIASDYMVGLNEIFPSPLQLPGPQDGQWEYFYPTPLQDMTSLYGTDMHSSGW